MFRLSALLPLGILFILPPAEGAAIHTVGNNGAANVLNSNVVLNYLFSGSHHLNYQGWVWSNANASNHPTGNPNVGGVVVSLPQTQVGPGKHQGEDNNGNNGNNGNNDNNGNDNNGNNGNNNDNGNNGNHNGEDHGGQDQPGGVPEPATFALAGAALTAVGLRRFKK